MAPLLGYTSDTTLGGHEHQIFILYGCYWLAVMFGPVATTPMSKEMLRLGLCCEQEGGW